MIDSPFLNEISLNMVFPPDDDKPPDIIEDSNNGIPLHVEEEYDWASGEISHDAMVGLCNKVCDVVKVQISRLQDNTPHPFVIGAPRCFNNIVYCNNHLCKQEHFRGDFNLHLEAYRIGRQSPVSDLLGLVFGVLQHKRSELDIIPRSLRIVEQRLDSILFKFRNGIRVRLQLVPVGEPRASRSLADNNSLSRQMEIWDPSRVLIPSPGLEQ